MDKRRQFESVTYAVRGKVVGKYLGQIGLVLAGLLLVPSVVALITGALGQAVSYGGAALLLALLALPLARLPTPAKVQINEGLAVTALTFILTPFFLTPAFVAAGLAPVDAIFEAVSGVTTTGLTTLESVEDKSTAFLFARAWVQWFSGLGVVVLSVAILAGHHAGARRLVEPDVARENIATATRTHARRITWIYLLLTLLGLAVLLLMKVDGFIAVTHVLAAISTGGFSPLDASLADPRVASAAPILTLLAMLGATSFSLHYLVWTRGWRQLILDIEFPSFLGFLLLVGGGMAALLWTGGMGGVQALYHGMAVGISAETTTGFSSLEIAQLSQGAKGLLVIAMFVGGCVGSTAGGIKILRLLIFARVVSLTGWRSAAPAHAVLEPWIGNRRLESLEIERALLLIILFCLTITLSWLVFLIMGQEPLDSLFEVVSAISIVGLSTGVTTAELPATLKAVLCFAMLAGRVEIIALLVVIYPGTWLGKRTD